MNRVFFFSALLCLSWHSCESAKILAVFPDPRTPNHYRMGASLLKKLAFRGHDVTMISPFFEKLLPDNYSYRDLIITDLYEEIQHKVNKTDFLALDALTPYHKLKHRSEENFKLTEKILRHKNVQKIIKNGEKFDVVIMSECGFHALKALAPHLEAPLIIFAPDGLDSNVNDYVANPSPVSYLPNSLLRLPVKMSFFERLLNSGFYVFERLFERNHVLPLHQRLVEKYIKSDKYDLNEVLYNNVSLVLSNSHPAVTQAVPFVPNIVEVGGFHIGPLTLVSMDVQKFLNEAPEGAILVHLGTNVKEPNVPPHKLEAILKTFESLPQRILWKFDNTRLNNTPANVMIRRWIPTSEILANPNVELLVTIGDSKTVLEAVYHAVPVLVIPFFDEKAINPRFVVDNGYGAVLDFADLTEKTFRKTVKKILGSRKIGKEVRERSRLFKDRIVDAMNETVYWVEYIAEHKGADFRRVAGGKLAVWQYLLVDVVGFLLGCVVVVVLGARALVLRCCRKKKASGGDNKKSEKSKQKRKQKTN